MDAVTIHRIWIAPAYDDPAAECQKFDRAVKNFRPLPAPW